MSTSKLCNPELLDFAIFPFLVASKKIPELSVVMLPGLVPDLPAALSITSSREKSAPPCTAGSLVTPLV